MSRWNSLASRLLVTIACAAPSSLQAGEAAAPASTLQRIAETGVIRIGYSVDTLPFSYVVADGPPIGYSIELCGRVAERLRTALGLAELKIDYIRRTASNRVALLDDGSIDLECVASTNSAVRRKSVGFSYSHFTTSPVFVSLKSNELKTLADLSGRSVASLKGSTNIGQLNAANRERNLHMAVLSTNTQTAAFDMVTDGRSSAFALDDILLTTMIAHSDNPQLYSLSREALGPIEPYGLMLRRDDAAFKAAVNAALSSIYASGEVEAIYARWFMSPIPPNNINLNWPMSDDLRAILAHPVDLD